MFVQYKLGDGDTVNIQATNSKRVDDAILLSQGRGQYEVVDIANKLSKVNVKTGQISAPVLKANDTPILTDEDYIEQDPKLSKL